VLLAAAVGHPAGTARAQERLLPELDWRAPDASSAMRRASGAAASASWDFVNDTVSDSWWTVRSPVDWRWCGWLTAAGVAGATTGLVFLADAEVREAAQASSGFRDFGEGIRWLGNGPGLAALTGSFALAGWLLDGAREKETARLLLESSAIGYGLGTGFKYTIGRSRPSSHEGPRSFEPFSGRVSMPSGEATSAFIMAGVVTSQYPSWPVQVTAWSLATAVGAGRIALDGHWSSDAFVSAALGIAISKAVVHFNRKRAAQRVEREKRGLAPEPVQARHSFAVTPRSFQWSYRF
jgi:hypothetical protein